MKGIRWDAAKHIATPSEGCGFWSAVTSVPGMYHYGEILNDDGTPINEYIKYMSVTDNRYSNGAAKDNGGIQQGYGGDWAVNRNVPGNKLVYWGESHDTYSNDEWSQNVDQATIDRAYACVATRNGATALYFARPNAKGFNNIKVGKGTDAYKSASITAVNQLRNAAGSAKDYCTTTGNAFSCTREGVGAVIVMKGSGNITIANGGGYCPAGSYKDLVSGGTFTVTSSNISGNVGSSGIAVIIKNGVTPPGPGPDPDPDPDPVTGSLYIIGNLATGGWSTTPGTGAAMTKSGDTYTAKGVKFVTASGETSCYFNITDYVGSTWDDLNMKANRYGAATEGEAITLGTAATVVKYANNVDASGCLSWTVPAGSYDITFDASAMKLTVVKAGDDPNPPTPPTPPTPGKHTVYFDNSDANWSPVYCYAWSTGASDQNAAWPGVSMTAGANNVYSYTSDVEYKNVIFTKGDDSGKTSDLTWTDGHIYKKDGSHKPYQDDPNPPVPPTPASMWILGNLATGGWSTTPGTGAAMTQSGNVYSASGVEFAAATGETICYFNFTDYVGSTWDDLNMKANRYGAATEGEAITLGTAAKVVKYANNVDASGCLSWTIAPGKYDVKFDASAMTVTVTKAGDDPNPPVPPTPGKHTVYFDNSDANWATVYCYAWITGSSDQNAAWPGVAMTAAGNNVYSYTSDVEYKNVIFNNNSGTQTGDLSWVDGHIYKKDGSHKLYQDNPPTPGKPTVTIAPNGGNVKGTATIVVTVKDATSVTGTFNGKSLTLATGSNNIAVSSYLTANGQQGTLSVTATNNEGSTTATASFTRRDAVNPDPIPGKNLITDYYKVNPEGQFGSNRTVNMQFNGAKANNALSHWTDADLIAQGVARDVCQAMKGNHERPIVDSYAVYAAYDSQNLYLGVQFVYTIWDIGGEGKQPGESKPYNMDGRLMIAFDLDPDDSFDGYIDGKKGIWNDEGAPGAKFENGVDAIWIGSTKPGVGIPGFFVPTPDGHASYDAAYCKKSTVQYGYADGLASCIDNVWGQKEFNFEAEVLKGNDGFVDLRSEIDDSAHTLYEFQIPLSLLGVSENYIKTNGIGVQYLDVYGASPVGGTPYDPSFFDNVKENYSMDKSSSKEKEDEDIITFAPARIGNGSSSVGNVTDDLASCVNVYGGHGVINIAGAEGSNVMVASISGQVYFNAVVDGNVAIDAAPGLYIVNVGGKGFKVVVK